MIFEGFLEARQVWKGTGGGRQPRIARRTSGRKLKKGSLRREGTGL
jgi:hypothetical protein